LRGAKQASRGGPVTREGTQRKSSGRDQHGSEERRDTRGIRGRETDANLGEEIGGIVGTSSQPSKNVNWGQGGDGTHPVSGAHFREKK